jgi:hypothetical protein
VTPIFGCERADETGPPSGDKIVAIVKGAETRKPCVHDPKLVARPGELVALNLAREPRRSGEEARIVPAGWLDARGKFSVSAQEPDRRLGTDGDLILPDCNSHDALEVMETHFERL